MSCLYYNTIYLKIFIKKLKPNRWYCIYSNIRFKRNYSGIPFYTVRTEVKGDKYNWTMAPFHINANYCETKLQRECPGLKDIIGQILYGLIFSVRTVRKTQLFILSSKTGSDNKRLTDHRLLS